MPTIDDLLKQRWTLINPKIPYVPETGIGSFWQVHADELGSPVGFETNLDDGSVGQAFVNGVVRWTAETGATVTP